MNHFYITLPSDSSAHYYPDNTVAHFTTRLPHRIRLDGDYEVGLAEFIYPYSWFNFDNEHKEMHVHFVDTSRTYDNIADFVNKGRAHDNIVFESGQHASEDALVKSLNEKIVESFPRRDVKASFKFDSVHKKMQLIVQCDNLTDEFFMSEKLRALFGFPFCGPYPCGEYTAESTFAINDGSNLIYVYCDIASFTPVGDVKAPILRVCNTSGKYGDMIRTIYTHPHYVPVARREIETIEININGEQGNPTPFEFGKSVVTLHFRRRHSLLPTS